MLKLPIALCLALTFCLSATAQETVKPKEPPEALIQRYKAAHAEQNIPAAMRLVCLDGVPDELKRVQEQSFREDFRHKIARYHMKPAPKDYIQRYEVQGKAFETTLPVIAVLEITYEENPEIDSPFEMVTYPVGLKDGQWMFASARPADD